MKAEQLRELDGAEIRRQLTDTQEQIFRLKFQFGMGQLEGVKKYREIRKDRARMLSVLREREIDPAKEQAAASVAATAKTKRTAKKANKAKKD